MRKGKRGGAFCATVTPDLTPWVLVNYQGRPDDVATLAHELGHAIHSMLASEHSLFTYHASLPLAETASTFGEMMLVDRLLANESDERVRRDLLFRQVDDAYATIMRQAFFALFERQAHELVQAGASVDDLSAAYLENLRRPVRGFGRDWRRVPLGMGLDPPHLSASPFTCTPMPLASCWSCRFTSSTRQEGESFKPRYLKILSAGGSMSPAQILLGGRHRYFPGRFLAGRVRRRARSRRTAGGHTGTLKAWYK